MTESKPMTKEELADKHMCRATGYSLACEILDGSHGDVDTLSVKILEWVKEDFLSGYEAAESEIRELREKLVVAEETLKHISSDHPVCPGCISEDVSLSEHYNFEASEALSRIRGGE